MRILIKITLYRNTPKGYNASYQRIHPRFFPSLRINWKKIRVSPPRVHRGRDRRRSSPKWGALASLFLILENDENGEKYRWISRVSTDRSFLSRGRINNLFEGIKFGFLCSIETAKNIRRSERDDERKRGREKKGDGEMKREREREHRGNENEKVGCTIVGGGEKRCRREDKYFGCGNLFYGREEREREIVCRESSKNNETGTKVGTDRKGREERDRVLGARETRELVPEKKKGAQRWFRFYRPFFIHHARTPSFHPSFLPSRPISKLLRSFQTRTVFNNAHDSRRNAPLFSEIKKFFTHRNYFNALVRRVYLLHV